MSALNHDHTLIAELERHLHDTPPSGRDAVLQAYLPRLTGHRSSQAVGLLTTITTNGLPGLSAAMISELSETLHPDVVLRVLPHVPRYPGYPVRYLYEKVSWRDALALVAEIRDGQSTFSTLMPPGDGLLALAILVASGTYLDRDTEQLLHRAAGSESVFLFGAARDPQQVLRTLESVRLYTWPRPNRDPELLAWALRNPALGGRPREVMLRKNAPSALAACRASGLLGTADLYQWLTGDGSDDHQLERIVTVLVLHDDVPGVRQFKLMALHKVERLDELAGQLAPPNVAALIRLLPIAGESELETAAALFTGWSSDLRSLLEAVKSLPTH